MSSRKDEPVAFIDITPKDNVVSVYIISSCPTRSSLVYYQCLIVQCGLHPFLGFRFFLTSHICCLWIQNVGYDFCKMNVAVILVCSLSQIIYNLKNSKVITNRKTSPLACSCKAVCRELPMAKPYNDVSL